MGVKGLWNLLEPVGRRINIEAIANKRLAIGECMIEYGPLCRAAPCSGRKPCQLPLLQQLHLQM